MNALGALGTVPPVTTYAAVVLAGGRSRRMGSDKLAEPVGGVAMLDRVLAAAAGASEVVCVGEPRTTSLPVRWVQEDPPHGGPAAAVAAGVDELDPAALVVVLLAGDLPWVTRAGVEQLVAALHATGTEGVMAVDAEGREQPLLSAWRADPLRTHLAAAQPLHGLPAFRTLAALSRSTLQLGAAADDADTPEELAAARARLSP
ncbi:molybdopterin-guanine dinucleotide biosynthesis protein A [Motilibacter rhizosphaerae]|uniref:Molybdopterin-guanine dinucleotide biosynthesis protein A n=1 Tax=Motilibacter rhizosphaerae TaxID=598652 RepID=A0A4Q7NA65_9ACTN|nr:molybdopterin-guanine dinucleotide biosynthesis protein A [Motilibacter rhizosphaerae]